MTERQKKFVDYYLQTGNASLAARKAGYSAKTAGTQGERMLKNVEIQKALGRRLKSMESKRVAQTQEVLEHLTAVMRGEEHEEIVTASGKKFTIPVSEKDRLKAAEMLLKVSGAFKEKIDVKMDATQLFVDTLEKIWNKKEP